MAITKPPVLPAWAESGDKVTPSNAEIQVGWPLSSIPPSRQRFNWLLNFLANGIRYFSRRGLPDYDAAETYMTGDRIIGDDGKTYRSLIDNNTAQTPSTSPTKWEEWAPSLSRLADLLQKQTYTAFTTAGAAPNFTLTPSPAIAAYAAGQRFRVKFHAAGTGADVLNVSTLGNKSLKQYDSTGAKVAAVIAASQLADVEYDGVDMVILDSLPPVSSQGNFAGLNSYNASATLPTSDIGKLVAFYGSTAAQTLTLPAVAGVAVGKNYIIVNQASVAVTVKGNAAENISRNVTGVGQTLSNTVVLNPGDSLVISSNGGSQWNAKGQSAPDMFPNSLSASGYQKLPNGMIIQWGTSGSVAVNSQLTVTLPITFPNGVKALSCNPDGWPSATNTSTGTFSASIISTSQISINNRTNVNAGTFQWMALGY